MTNWGPTPTRVRGQPLAVIGLIVILWVAFRISVIQLPAPHRVLPVTDRFFAGAMAHPRDDRLLGPGKASTASQATTSTARGASYPTLAPERPSPPHPPVRWGTSEAMKRQYSANQALLWMAAMSGAPIPPMIASLARLQPPLQFSSHAQATPPSRPARWSADGWLLLRQGGSLAAPAGAVAPPVYGGSQAGAVIRYRLDPQSPHKPAAYIRATRGISHDGESELAAGIAARPLGDLAVTAHAEIRTAFRQGEIRTRPALFLSAGLERVDLPLGVDAHGYAQAGYVGGSDATPFVDGSIVADRRLAQHGKAEMRVGAGAWGGMQKGAGRLDLGPSAALRLTLGDMPARVSIDYRLRVAGDAEPSQGAALTLSTGF